MFDIDDLIGKVVTVRGLSGEEIIGKLMGTHPDTTIITLGEPRVVVINNNEVSLLPYVLTASAELIDFNINTVVSIIETFENTAKEYLEVISEE